MKTLTQSKPQHLHPHRKHPKGNTANRNTANRNTTKETPQRKHRKGNTPKETCIQKCTVDVIVLRHFPSTKIAFKDSSNLVLIFIVLIFTVLIFTVQICVKLHHHVFKGIGILATVVNEATKAAKDQTSPDW